MTKPLMFLFCCVVQLFQSFCLKNSKSLQLKSIKSIMLQGFQVRLDNCLKNKHKQNKLYFLNVKKTIWADL